MKKQPSIRNTLAVAAAALVGASPTAAAGLNHSETSVLVYSERNRVRATEAVFSLDKLLQSGRQFSMRLTYDGLTGASPTGGSPSKQPQTLTRPSGGSVTTVAAGELPVDHSFGETRFAAELGLSGRLDIRTSADAAIRGSSEHDYKSIGINGGIVRDFDDLRTSLGLAVSISHDVNSPLGGVPAPLTSTSLVVENQNGTRITNGSRPKNVVDLVLSFNRVLGQSTVGRVDYSFDYASGYLTDPYKIISVVQPPDSADPGEPVDQLYERRPSKRASHALAVAVRHRIHGAITETGYRFFLDDWGIRSHTVSLSLHAPLSRRIDIEPHARWYHQNRADFSRPFLVQGAPLPQYVSSDARLAEFNALTYGLNVSFPTSPSSRLTLATEFYSQRGDRSPPESFGPLRAFNLFPDLNAVMLRLNLTHEF